MTVASASRVERLEATAYTVPLDEEESDGTLAWDSVTCVVALAHCDGLTGIGYTYGPAAVAGFLERELAGVVAGMDPLGPQSAWAAMQRAVRNSGQAGMAALAVSAVDVSLWDLKAKLLGVALADLLGRRRDRVPVYGSGGFTSYSDERLHAQLSDWRELGRVKMKVGRDPGSDPDRLAVARDAIGAGAELFVDANGAFTPTEALAWAERYADYGVTWLEEPVTSQDRAGMRRVRDAAPAGMAVAAGEYEWTLPGLADLAGSVDVLQADATRCGGITAMLRADGLCAARSLPFSAHCAPSISAHVCAAMEWARHIEYFHDHVVAENLLFEGTLSPEHGGLLPDPERPGLGIEPRDGIEEWRSS